MEILIAILAVALLALVVFVVSAPLRAVRTESRVHVEAQARLEAEREAKYREIRDTELDYRTGKLSKEDFAMTDGALRGEAIEILDRLAVLESERARNPSRATSRDA